MRKVLGLLGIAGLAHAEPLAYPAPLWDNIYLIWLFIAVVIYLIVSVPMLYFMFKYRYKKGVNEVGEHIHGNNALEIVWTLIPLLVVIYLATQAFAYYRDQRTPPENAMELKITAFMWGWEVEYPNGKKVYAFFNEQYQIPEEQK